MPRAAVFWPLASKGTIRGILNALDMTSSLASSDMSLDEVGRMHG